MSNSEIGLPNGLFRETLVWQLKETSPNTAAHTELAAKVRKLGVENVAKKVPGMAFTKLDDPSSVYHLFAVSTDRPDVIGKETVGYVDMHFSNLDRAFFGRRVLTDERILGYVIEDTSERRAFIVDYAPNLGLRGHARRTQQARIIIAKLADMQERYQLHTVLGTDYLDEDLPEEERLYYFRVLR